jgi:hypothetical protein
LSPSINATPFSELEANNSLISVLEINEMFAKSVPARKWNTYRCNIAEYSHRSSTLPRDDHDNLEKKASGTTDERFEKVV